MKLQLEIMDVVPTDTYISMQRVKFIMIHISACKGLSLSYTGPHIV